MSFLCKNEKNAHFCTKLKFAALLFSILIINTSCSNTKYLHNNEILFKKNKIKIENKKNIKINPNIIDELNKVLYPKTNTKILGLKIPLYIYNITNTQKNKGLKHYLRTKLGEPPVLYREKNNNDVTNLLLNRLNINGYFNSKITVSPKIKKKRASITYSIKLSKPYIIDTIIYQIKKVTLTVNL